MEKYILRKLTITGVLVLLIIGMTAPAEQIMESREKNPDRDELTLQHSIQISRNDLVFERLIGFDLVRLQDCSQLNIVGKPAVPVIELNLALPNGMMVTDVRVVETQQETIPGEYVLFPAQPARITDGYDQELVFVKPDPALYTSSQLYPSDIVEFVHQSDIAGQSIAVLQLFPMHYLPSEQQLLLYTSITVELIGTSGNLCGDYLSPGISMRGRESIERMVRGIVCNPDDVTLQNAPGGMHMMPLMPDETFEYVIITRESWVDAFQPLADWKTRKGVLASIVTVEWINSTYTGDDTPDKIQAFVADAYATWGTVYFLLGGDADVVPFKSKMYAIELRPGEGIIVNAPSDTYYADFDQDFMCEVHVGRAAVNRSTNVSTFINKIFTYEQNPPEEYTKNIGLFGFYVGGIVTGEDIKEYINDTYISGSWEVTTVYESDYPGVNLKEAVIDTINNGQHLINHIDHADYDKMYVGLFHDPTWYLTRGDVDALHNGDRQSILYTVGCNAVAFDFDHCIAEHFVRNPNGGCVAFIGNSRVGFYYAYDPFRYSHRYDIEFYESLFDDNFYILGECFTDHKNDGITWGPGDDIMQCIFDELTLLGDPELPIWTRDPHTYIGFNVSHPDTVSLGSSEFTVHVEEYLVQYPEEHWPGIAQVCLWKDNEIYEINWTDIQGNVTFTITPTSAGTLYVTVTEHNIIPYLGEAVIETQLIPDPEQSTLTLTAEEHSGLTTCPAGDAFWGAGLYEYLKVTVRTSTGEPIPGIPMSEFEFTVTAAPETVFWQNLSCPILAADPITDVNGDIRFTIQSNSSLVGLITIACNVMGVDLNDNANLSCISYDYDTDLVTMNGVVDLIDFAQFAQDYSSTLQRSDFDWTGHVDLVDFAMFASHYGHSSLS